MNVRPHVHELKIGNLGSSRWYVSYGDQFAEVYCTEDKGWFPKALTPEARTALLEAKARELIFAHDEESQRAARETIVGRIQSRLQQKNRWGSEQLDNTY